MKIYGAIMNARHVMEDLYEVQLPSGMWLDEPVTWNELKGWDGYVYVLREFSIECMDKTTFDLFAYEAENLKPVINRLSYNEDDTWLTYLEESFH